MLIFIICKNLFKTLKKKKKLSIYSYFNLTELILSIFKLEYFDIITKL